MRHAFRPSPKITDVPAQCHHWDAFAVDGAWSVSSGSEPAACGESNRTWTFALGSHNHGY
jgi:hypothetical protein